MNECVRRAQNGDTRAFEALYRTHVGRVHAICLRMSADVERAERLTQDVFVRAWERIGSFRGESAFRTWLHRIAVNTALEDRRERGRWRSRFRLGEDQDRAEHGGYRGRPEARIDLERAIARLPERARLVFLLHDVEGYRHGEIAEMAGMAPGTSKAQLHRARRLLRKMLER